MKFVKVLIIEDQPELAKNAEREILDAFESNPDYSINVSIENDFDEGLKKLEQRECDVVILDVRRDATDSLAENTKAGHDLFLSFKARRFAPVIFWTALPNEVNTEEMLPLVAVVSKDEMEKLPEAIEQAIKSGALDTISEIEEHVATVLRNHMWTELGPNWDEYTKDSDSRGVAQILMSRLMRILENSREDKLTSKPSHRYIYPSASEHSAPGDVLRKSDGTWWVTLTPACDFAQNKADYILLARASSLEEHPKYIKWADRYRETENKPGEHRAKNEWANLRRDVLASTRGRFHYIPQFREIPDLVVDLDQVCTEPIQEFRKYESVASLASPFAEALIIQHSQHRGRIGIPDIDSDLVRTRFSEDIDSSPVDV